MNKYAESKESKIRKLKNLTDEQKEELITLFNKYNYLESKIDWNNNDLTYEDFTDVIALAGKSRSSQKKYGIEGLVEGKDYKYFGEGSNSKIGNYKLYQPLTYEGSKTLASNKVEPVKENGAKWCISYQKSSSYWDDYTERNIKFLFVLTEDTKYAITFYPEESVPAHPIEVYSFEDKNLRYPEWCDSDEFLADKISQIIKTLPRTVFLPFDTWFNYCFQKNPDGTYDFTRKVLDDLEKEEGIRYDVDMSEYNLGYGGFILQLTRKFLSFVEGGKFTIKFHKWDIKVGGQRKQVPFHIYSFKLRSLEGCPDIINGDFNCDYNDLTSLKGGPKVVKGDYSCEKCKLTSLEGAPEEIAGTFDCKINNLSTLIGAPKKTGMSFLCQQNNLTNLVGCPEEIGGALRCDYNKITSLKGIGNVIAKWGGGIYVSRNPLESFKYLNKSNGNIYAVEVPKNIKLGDDLQEVKGVIYSNNVSLLRQAEARGFKTDETRRFDFQ